MYSLNAPVPGRVSALAADLAARATAAAAGDRGTVDVRDDHTLVLKRLPEAPFDRLDASVRETIAGTPPFAARIARAGVFAEAVAGRSPVLYLAVESPELRALHDRLAEAFDPVDGIEGEDYVPHVTVSRGGPLAAVRAVAGPVEPVEWSVSELLLWDAERSVPAARLPLPV
ncbi:MAG: 2'-5' RNA ligase family protein [Salinirussus sp.]